MLNLQVMVVLCLRQYTFRYWNHGELVDVDVDCEFDDDYEDKYRQKDL